MYSPGDAFPVARTSFDAVSWCGTWRDPQLATADFKLLISGLLKRCLSRTSASEFWAVVTWALAALIDGRYPHEDWNGTVYEAGTKEYARAGDWLVGGYFCVLWQISCDSDWSGNTLKLEHASSKLLCPWCKANCAEEDGDDDFYAAHGFPIAPWDDISDDPEWRKRVFSLHLTQTK